MHKVHENGTAAVTSSVASSIANAPAPFLSKTYDMVDDPSTDSIVSWGQNGNSFVVWSDADCATFLLPKYFKHKNFSSFVRQLNTYGFRKIDSDRWEFANEGFLRGQKHLLKGISRRKPAPVLSHQQFSQVQSTSAAPSVEVAKFGIEEDVESLKKDKNVLMQELVRLRQQQQATDHQLQTVGQRVHSMEQRQQHMMSFLAKAMQSPGFLSQLVHQQNEANRRIMGGGTKKRRLPRQEEDILISRYGPSTSPDGQIVKYQPLMNEAAKAMLRQILKINASARLEPTINNTNSFLIDGVPSSNALDIGGSSSRVSGLTLSEVLPGPLKSHTASGGVPSSHSPTAISDAKSSPCLSTGKDSMTQFPGTNLLNNSNEVDPLLSQFSEIQASIAESTNGVPDTVFPGSRTEDMEYMAMISGLEDGGIPVVTDDFSSDPDIDILLDENPKLPGINDVFWEQFLSANPLNGNTDENNSSTLLEGVEKEHELDTGPESGWERTRHMNHLTEQMGLLASGSAVV